MCACERSRGRPVVAAGSAPPAYCPDAVRVHIVDPSAYTPPYDHALCSALAAQGAQVRLYTSRFAYGAVAAPDGYERVERFYRLAGRAGDPRVRRALKLVEHVPDMLGYRREAR